MLNKLEETIQNLIVEAAGAMAKQISQAVHASLAASTASNGAGAAAVPKRRGRPPGPQAKAATAAPAPVAKGKRGGKKRRAISHAELNAVLNVLAKKAGLTSVQIQKEAGIDARQAARVLGKLRDTKQVKWKGARSGAAYSAAGTSAVATAAAASPRTEKVAKAVKAVKPAKPNGKKGRGFRTYGDADLARALEVIKAKRGLRPSQYLAESKMDQKVWDNVVYKLKSDGKIKVVGKGRNTSYLAV